MRTAVIATSLLAASMAVSCRAAETGGNDAPEPESTPPIVQPGAPGQPSREISAAEAADVAGTTYTEADVQFMQGMIHHHAQALAMTALVPERTEREDMRALALRIELSQQDEIGMMETWLQQRGAEVPAMHEHHGADAPMMPGMLTPEQIAALAAASGATFDRLFLEGMVRHHQGALVMVDELYAISGAGQETYISEFAAEVVADQGAEIARMNAMLNAMLEEPRE